MHISNDRHSSRPSIRRGSLNFSPSNALLCGTALVSAAFIGTFGASPVRAQVINIIGAAAPQNEVNNANCVSATDCIFISTVGGPANTITLDNNGNLDAGDDGIETATEGASITITNDAAITAVDEGILATIGSFTNTGGDGGDGGDGGAGGNWRRRAEPERPAPAESTEIDGAAGAAGAPVPPAEPVGTAATTYRRRRRARYRQ